MSKTRVIARDIPVHGEYDGDGKLEGLVVDTGDVLGDILEGSYVDHEEEDGNDEGGQEALDVPSRGPQRAR